MYHLLQNLTLIEASSFVASPTAGLYLAQMGAEVIRIDQIGGGPDFKRWPLTDKGNSLYWENLNRAKKSVALDLAQPEGRELLQKLAAKTGLLITNFPVNSFLSHDKLAALNPAMITVRVMGQADGGTALDYTVNSAVGIPYMTGPGSLGNEPVNHVLAAWDLLTGAYAAFALLAALRHRDATGEGQEIRIPLQDVATASVANMGMIAEVLYSGANRKRLGNAVYGAFGRDFETADGKRVMIMALTPKQWSGLVSVLGIEAEIAAIEGERGVRFAKDEGLRFAHRDALFPLVEAKVKARNWAELDAAMAAAGCCYGAYQTMAEAARDPALVRENPVFGRAENPSGFDYPAPGAFATIPQQQRQPPQPAPHLGADSDDILTNLLGLSAAELDTLKSQGLIAP
ncbi:MAG: CoA transferase [Sphingorhabdus sp.]